jgi:hypothetical protein
VVGDSESKVFLQGDDVPWADSVVRTEAERCGSSVLDEFALEKPMFENRAPWRGGGGGGGDLTPSMGSLMFWLGLKTGPSSDC